jgi:hypothetical protein
VTFYATSILSERRMILSLLSENLYGDGDVRANEHLGISSSPI